MHIWRIPIFLAMISMIGLLSALVGDGPWDLLSWFTLGTPLLVIAWFLQKPKSSKKNPERKSI